MKNKIITVLIWIVTCFMPFISTMEEKAIMYYLVGIVLVVILFLKRKELTFDAKDKLLLFFLLLASISTLFAVNRENALWGSRGRCEGIFMIVIYASLYYTAKNHFLYYKKYITVVFSVACILSIYALFQYYDFMPIHKFFGIEYKLNFSSSTLYNRNFFASYLSIFLPIAMGVFLFKGKKFWTFCSSILFAALLCTLTRSAWIAFGVYSLIRWNICI